MNGSRNFGTPPPGGGWLNTGGGSWEHKGPLVYQGHIFPIGGIAISRTPPRGPWKKPWTPTPPNQRQLNAAQKMADRRAQEQAQRQREQAQARERAQKEARERAARERQQREEQERRVREQRQQEQRAQQQHQRDLHDQEVHRERERRERLRQIEERRRAQRSTILGTALAGMVPPAFRAYALRRPPEFLNAQGPELVIKQAQRAAAEVKMGMDNFSFWVTQAASVIAGLVGMPGEYMATVGVTKALQEVTRRVNTMVSNSAVQMSSTLGRTATSAAPKSIDQVLMECRNEAYNIATKLARQTTAEGGTISPQRYGEIIDALFKSLVQHAKRNGLVPQTIRTAPPPLAISGTRLPRGGAIDVWDSATGVGWDVMKANVRGVAGHERYLNRAMPDGTRIRDVRPLVYPRQ